MVLLGARRACAAGKGARTLRSPLPTLSRARVASCHLTPTSVWYETRSRSGQHHWFLCTGFTKVITLTSPPQKMVPPTWDWDLRVGFLAFWSPATYGSHINKGRSFRWGWAQTSQCRQASREGGLYFKRELAADVIYGLQHCTTVKPLCTCRCAATSSVRHSRFLSSQLRDPIALIAVVERWQLRERPREWLACRVEERKHLWPNGLAKVRQGLVVQ